MKNEMPQYRTDFPIDNRVIEKIKRGIRYFFLVYEAKHTQVVLGRSCIVEDDVWVAHCIEDGVPIFKRIGGGGTVVLSKGIVIISVGGISDTPFHLKEHMNSVNTTIMMALQHIGIRNLSIKGISDIAIENKKVLGSSLYRRRNMVLYQGSLLYDPDFSLFDRYLTNPSRMPDYRQNRSHHEFLTSIVREGYQVEIKKLMKTIRRFLRKGAPWNTFELE